MDPDGINKKSFGKSSTVDNFYQITLPHENSGGGFEASFKEGDFKGLKSFKGLKGGAGEGGGC